MALKFKLICFLLFTCIVIKAGNCDTSVVLGKCREAKKLFGSDLTTAEKLSHEAYNESLKCRNEYAFFEALIGLGKLYSIKDNHDTVVKLLTPYMYDAKLTKSQKARVFHSLGGAYTNMMKLEKGLEYSIKSLKLYEELKDTLNKIRLMVNVANVFQQQKNFKNADEYLREAEKEALRLNNETMIGNVYNTMGILYAEDGQLDSSEVFFLRSTKFREKLNDQSTLVWNYNNLGGIYVLMKKYKPAAVYLEKALKLFEEQGNFDGQSSASNNLGELYLKMGDKEKSLKYFSFSRALYQKTNNPDNLENLYANLIGYYEELGQYHTALKYSDSLIQLMDTIHGNQLNESIAEMQVKYGTEKKDLELAKKNAELNVKEEEKKRQSVIITFAIVGLLALVIFSVFIFRSLQRNKLATKIISSQKQKVEIQNHLLGEKNKEIMDSINYAKRLQDAILPPDTLWKKQLPLSTVLYKPKDVVAGDFYWMETDGDLVLFAAADCTGHGVPGALVSVVCSNALNRVVKEFKIQDPGQILNKVRELVIETFEKSESEIKDGMDISLCCLNLKTKVLLWAGANNPLWIIKNEEVKEITADKMPIGKYAELKDFTTHKFQLEQGDCIYIFTDGYADQFGGPKGKKFKYKQLNELLLSVHKKDAIEQKQILDAKFEEWRGDLEQIDDVCVIGVRIC